MRTSLALAALAVVLALPAAVGAQSEDAQYCSALTNKYLAYVSSSTGKRPRPPPAYVSVAMSKCRSEAPASIAVLEKALQNAQVALPPRG